MCRRKARNNRKIKLHVMIIRIEKLIINFVRSHVSEREVNVEGRVVHITNYDKQLKARVYAPWRSER